MQAQESMFCLEIHKKLLSESEFDQGTMSATSTQESFCDITFEWGFGVNMWWQKQILSRDLKGLGIGNYSSYMFRQF